MIEVSKEAAKLALPEEEYHVNDVFSTGSTDMGDLSCLMPVIHPYAGGARGISHGNNYEVFDAEKACVSNAKWQLAMLLILLGNGAERAKSIIKEFKPMFASKEEFFAYQDSLNTSGDRIIYREDGIAEIKLN